MKLAFINNNGKIGGHVGHAKNITLYDFESKNFSHHTPEVTGGGARAKWLYDAGATGLVLSSTGAGAFRHMTQLGIRIYDGSGLSLEEALNAYNENELDDFDLSNASNHAKSHTHGECCEGDECGDEHEHKHNHQETHEGCCGGGHHTRENVHKKDKCC